VTSFNQRKLALSLLTGALAASFMGGCSTLNSNPFAPAAAPSAAQAAGLPITHPERAEEFKLLWGDIGAHTTAIPISDSRVRIQSKGKLISGEDKPAHNFLIRAASETINAKKDGFVILHVDYVSSGSILPSISPSLNISSRGWIGTYEDFLEDRNEQNIFSGNNAIKKKAVDGVIMMIDKDEFPNRDRFTASEIYSNLLNFQAR